MNLEYRKTTESEWINTARSRHRVALEQLTFLGFEELGVYGERVARHGFWLGLSGIIGSVGLLVSEVAHMDGRLNVEGFYPLLYSRKAAAYACVSAMGVSFYTLFLDGTCAVSSAYRGIEVWDKEARLYKVSSPRSIPRAWADHQEMVKSFQAAGLTPREDPGMDEYFAMVKRQSEYFLSQPRSFSLPAVLSLTVQSFGLLIAAVMLVCLAGNVIYRLHPTCTFVEKLAILSIPVNILVVLGSVAAAWLAARWQSGLGTINGLGSKLIGADPRATQGGYVSTKWLVFVGLPFLPVRSYQVLGEFRSGGSLLNYKLRPMGGMHWKQVKETARKSMLGYLLAAALFAAIVAGMFYACGAN